MAPEDGSSGGAPAGLAEAEGALGGVEDATPGCEDAPPPGVEGLCYAGEMLPGPHEGAPEGLSAPAYTVELPPCHGVPGPTLGELPVAEEQVAAPLPSAAAPPSEPPARGKCLIYNWQEERATNHLDCVPGPEYGTEGFFYRHGHPGLLTLQFPAGLAKSTTMKDSYRRPWRTGLPVRGQREAKLEWLLCQKHSKALLEQQVFPPRKPMESLSTMHHDYVCEGFVSVPPPPTKPHCYQLEQPQTFWREHARQLPGVSAIPTEDAPFKKCSTFTTPMMDQLRQPLL